MYLILIPDLYLLFITKNIYFFSLSFAIFVFLCSVFRTSKYLYLLFPIYTLIPIYLYYIFIYKVSINTQVLSFVLETNYQEALSFIGYKAVFYFFIIIFWIVFCIYLSYRNFKKPIVWKHRSKWWVLSIGVVYLIIVFTLNHQVSSEIDNNFKEDNFLVEDSNTFIDDLKKTYPMGLLIASFELLKEQKKINNEFDKNTSFKFNAVQVKKLKEKQVYILVIGETSRRENWQLNGYYRQTNPLLSKQTNLINFSNMISISSATRSSIPMILTRKPAEQVYKFTFPEKSIISVFKEAGFKTYWLSTQQKFGAFDTTTSVYAKEADEMHFLNKANYTDAGELDDVLIPEFDKIINSNEKKQFIVIHTLGSHYNYKHRYPNRFNIFTPSLNEVENYSLQEQKYRTQLLNSYDNSIVFTDFLLNEFLENLKKKKDISSFLLYSSDHGEDLFDEGCDKSGHGLETARNFEIASFVWYSENFVNENKMRVEYLNENRYRKINQTSIFPTLVDAANIQIENDDLNKSLLKNFKEYPRMVLGGKDFDNSDFDGACRLIK